jgi:hypothetical protein
VIQKVTESVIPVELKTSLSVPTAVAVSEHSQTSLSIETQSSSTFASVTPIRTTQSHLGNVVVSSETRQSWSSTSTPPSLITASLTRPKTPTSNDLSTITSIPEPNRQDWGVFPWGDHPPWTGWSWGNSTIPINSCWQTQYPSEQKSPWWPNCHVCVTFCLY